MQNENGLGWQVAFGIFGFFFAGGLSLASGNEIMTSLTRGAIGMFGLFLLAYLFRIALQLFVGKVEQPDATLGATIDLLVGELAAPAEGQVPVAEDDDFVPMFPKTNRTEEAFKDIDPQKLAEALRHLDD